MPDQLLEETLVISDSLSIGLGLISGETLSLSDDLSLVEGKLISLSDSLSFSDATVVGLWVNKLQALNDSISLSDFIQSSNGLVLSDQLSLLDALVKIQANIEIAFINNLGERLVLVDFISPSPLMPGSRSFSDSLVLGDQIFVSLGVPTLSESLSDQLSLSDSLTIEIGNRIFGETISLSDQLIVDLQEPFENYVRRYLNDVI